MRYAHPPLRHGMTAIAAVLAFSSTPLFAQSADPAPDSAAPVLVTPPPVIAAPAPTVAAPAPAAAAPMQTVQTLPPAPVVDTSAAAAPAAKPVTRTKTATKSTTVKATEAPTTPAPLAKAPSTPTIAPLPVAASESPVAAKPVVTPAPIVKQQTTQTTQATDETLPIAAGAGLVVLALAGGAFAMGRRKRRDEDGDVVSEPVVLSEPLVAEPDPVLVDRPMVHAEPALARADADTVQHVADRQIAVEPVLAAERLDGPVTALPAGFDLSRYGPHVQAAYRGPTADNPSLSLRRRLSHARFYDQRERMGNMPASPIETREMPAPQPVAQAARTTDHITTRVRQPRPSFRPVFNS